VVYTQAKIIISEVKTKNDGVNLRHLHFWSKQDKIYNTMEYKPEKIEQKWRKIWEEKKLYRTEDELEGKENFYHLVMFPYSSGNLHIGHWYNFAPADVFARLKRMQGFNVLSPIGFDSFGLPAEGAAIKHGIHPLEWTEKNVARMMEQIKTMGTIYDLERTVYTHRPDYYHWTQWMFLQLYRAGLAYRKKARVNWCPACKSILANEQAEGGKCWRCECLVEQRAVEQWFFKITKYADQLLEGLKGLDWPERTIIMQRNWIGRSEGIEIQFPIAGKDGTVPAFTTRPDTIFGATFFVLAPEHPKVLDITTEEQRKEVEEYLERTKKKTELERISEVKEKTGVFTGAFVKNPLSGEKIPVYIADFVIMGYGTGAIMGVPGHDQRDWGFAKSHGLEIKEVILGGDVTKEAYTGEGKLVNSGKYNGLDWQEAIKKISDELESRGLGKRTVQYHLRDWLVSRQRYWGAPIPIVHCPKCGEVPVPEGDLPVLLPEIENYEPKEGESPLARSEEFVKTNCPRCGGQARRDTDTMDTFVCSSWYYLRYTDPKNDKEFANKEKIKAWLPVDMYVGGTEHTVLHLLYSRFFTKVLKDLGYLEFDEPFLSLRHQGVILGEDNQKMSKSRGNVVDPDDYVKKYGTDTVRLYLCFMAPYEQGGPWSAKGILGVFRFLKKVAGLEDRLDQGTGLSPKLVHRTIKKVTEDIEQFKFNTAVSSLMILVNEAKKQGISKQDYKILLRLLAPFAPHLAEELWQRMGKQFSIHNQPWPSYDPQQIEEEKITLIIQINGRTRDKVEVEAGISQQKAEQLALSREKIQKWIEGKEIKNIFFVPQKLLNIVV
jgi:leucyl-tRNA synthetase